MPLDTFTYYLLKVGFIPPLRAHSVFRKIEVPKEMQKKLKISIYLAQ